MTSLGCTAADLAREESYRGAVVAVDACLRRGVPLRELDRRIVAMAGWPGVDQARRVAAFADPRSESRLESISRVGFADLGLPAPELQVEVWWDGVLIARVDFLWEALLVVGEADGLGKYVTHADLVAEKWRQDRLHDAGLVTARWGWDEAWRPERLRAPLVRAFARGAAGRLAPGVRLVRTSPSPRCSWAA